MSSFQAAEILAKGALNEARAMRMPEREELTDEELPTAKPTQKDRRRNERKDRATRKKMEAAERELANRPPPRPEDPPEWNATEDNINRGLEMGFDAALIHESETKRDTKLKAEDISTEKNGSIIKVTTREGFGDVHPGVGDDVWVHYTSKIHREFGLPADIYDSTYDRREPWKFECGRGEAIKAFDRAVMSMKQGEIAVITANMRNCYLPDELDILYNQRSGPKIPPGFKDMVKRAKTLVFEIELVKWIGWNISPNKGEETIFKSNQREGSGIKNPNDDAVVKLLAIGYHDGRRFYDKELEYVMGEGVAFGLPEGMDLALRKFREGERSLVHFKPKWAYGRPGKPEFGIPPDACVDFDVTLISHSEFRDCWEYDTPGRMQLGERMRVEANEVFKEGNYALAQAKYTRMWYQLYSDKEGPDKDTQRERDRLWVACNLNMALCMIKRGMTPYEAVKCCDAVLKLEPENVKAYFRRGQARQLQNDWEDAARDFKKVLEFDPTNAAAKKEIWNCKQGHREWNQEQIRTYRSLFRFDKYQPKALKENKPMAALLGEEEEKEEEEEEEESSESSSSSSEEESDTESIDSSSSSSRHITTDEEKEKEEMREQEEQGKEVKKKSRYEGRDDWEVVAGQKEDGEEEEKQNEEQNVEQEKQNEEQNVEQE